MQFFTAGAAAPAPPRRFVHARDLRHLSGLGNQPAKAAGFGRIATASVTAWHPAPSSMGGARRQPRAPRKRAGGMAEV
ncbi:hypothetical protein AAHH79_37170, partial [Burkholderia pseudomallei]